MDNTKTLGSIFTRDSTDYVSVLGDREQHGCFGCTFLGQMMINSFVGDRCLAPEAPCMSFGDLSVIYVKKENK